MRETAKTAKSGGHGGRAARQPRQGATKGDGKVMTIRQARHEDAAAVARIHNHYIAGTSVTFAAVPRTPQEVAARIAAGTMLVADDGDITGFAAYGQFRANDGYRHAAEHTILLAPGASGKGTGRALMEALVDRVRADAFHTLWAGISGENPAGVGFHAAMGFEHVARLPEVGRKFDRWIDLILMMRRL